MTLAAVLTRSLLSGSEMEQIKQAKAFVERMKERKILMSETIALARTRMDVAVRRAALARAAANPNCVHAPRLPIPHTRDFARTRPSAEKAAGGSGGPAGVSTVPPQWRQDRQGLAEEAEEGEHV